MYDYKKLLKITSVFCPDCETDDFCDGGEGWVHLGRLNAFLVKCGLAPIPESSLDGISTDLVESDFVEPWIEPDDPRDMEQGGS